MSVITLGVVDFQRSLKFYRDGLGFPTHAYDDSANHVMFALDGCWLSLYPLKLLAEDAQVADEGTGFARFTIAHNVKSRSDVDAVFNLAVAAGALPIKRPQEVFWGGYSGYFADPDGFLWEVAHNPFTDLT